MTIVDQHLVESVEELMGMEGEHEVIKPSVQPINISPSPSLSILNKFIPTIKGRKLGILLGDGFDDNNLEEIKKAFLAEGCAVEIVSKKISGATSSTGTMIPADHTIQGGPSFVFDFLAVMSGSKGFSDLRAFPAFKNWINDGYNRLKVIGVSLDKGDKIHFPDQNESGIVKMFDQNATSEFLDLGKQGRVWDRI